MAGGIKKNSLKLSIVLGFSHSMYLKLSAMFHANETFLEDLNEKIMEYLNQTNVKKQESLDINKTELKKAFENGNPTELAYLLGFYHNLLNNLI